MLTLTHFLHHMSESLNEMIIRNKDLSLWPEIISRLVGGKSINNIQLDFDGMVLFIDRKNDIFVRAKSVYIRRGKMTERVFHNGIANINVVDFLTHDIEGAYYSDGNIEMRMKNDDLAIVFVLEDMVEPVVVSDGTDLWI